MVIISATFICNKCKKDETLNFDRVRPLAQGAKPEKWWTGAWRGYNKGKSPSHLCPDCYKVEFPS